MEVKIHIFQGHGSGLDDGKIMWKVMKKWTAVSKNSDVCVGDESNE